MNQTEAIKKAEDRLNLCIHISECSENKGLAKIYGNEAEWLSDVLWTAKQYVQMEEANNARNHNHRQRCGNR